MIAALGGKTPKIAESSFVSEAACVIGDVEIGEDCAVFPGAVIRADFGRIRIGDQVLVEDNAVVHSGVSGLVIGNDVTLGHGAVVNCAAIGSKVLVGINAAILHDAEIGDRCIIGAGTVVGHGMHVPSGSFVTGVPGKIAGKASEEQLKWVEREPKLFNWMLDLYRKQKP
ncbi:MAG: gamma carbonic anhydrase family protein [Chloroflexi bacterium]|nr:gamma carbonic anhydrase family protein [Chloroflexota bacterium]